MKQLAQGHGGKSVAEARTGAKASSMPIFCLNHQKPLPSLSFSPAHPSAAVQSPILRIEGKNIETLIRVHLYFSKGLREERRYNVRD